MDVADLLADLFGRVPEEIHAAVDGLGPDDLVWAPGPGANPIGWLIWHLTRVEDGHIAELIDGEEQRWATGGWAATFGLDPDPGNSGWGHTAEQVAAVRPESVEALLAYYEVVNERTRRFLADLTPADLDRVVDERWDPPVTLGVRLISIADDQVQHAGQAGYVRGLLDAAR